uniref:Uncharacterized protein n=1 Tax=Ixodes ricinus TaxID=34613 RepID=A0A6B0UGZ1_IXORI
MVCTFINVFLAFIFICCVNACHVVFDSIRIGVAVVPQFPALGFSALSKWEGHNCPLVLPPHVTCVFVSLARSLLLWRRKIMHSCTLSTMKIYSSKPFLFLPCSSLCV